MDGRKIQMRFLIQRVNEAKVEVDGETVGSIGKGFLVLIGISGTDDTAVADKMIKKLTGLRIFEDENGKTNLDLKAVGGQLLLISQFTLYADCRRGNRPSFTDAGAPDKAEQLYHYIIEGCRREIAVVEMKVSLVNDGPFTVFLDSAEICH